MQAARPRLRGRGDGRAVPRAGHPRPAVGRMCPAYARGCYGCFGPREAANVAEPGRLATAAAPGRTRSPTSRDCSPGFTAVRAARSDAGDRLGRRRSPERRHADARDVAPPEVGPTVDVASADARRGRGLAPSRVRDGRVEQAQLADLRGARATSSDSSSGGRRTRSSTSSRASAASARRLPDDRGPRLRGALRGRRSTRSCAASVGSCTAASGSRATRSTSTSSTPRTSSATPRPSSWRATTARRSRRGLALKRAGQPHRRRCSAVGRSIR